MLKQLVGTLVGFTALAISGLTLWLIYGSVLHPEPGAKADPLTLWAIMYVLGFLAFVVALFGIRLLVPRWRVEGGRVIGHRGLIAFALLYGLLLLLSLADGSGFVLR